MHTGFKFTSPSHHAFTFYTDSLFTQRDYVSGFMIRFLARTKLAQLKLKLNQYIINCAIPLSLTTCNSIIMCFVVINVLAINSTSPFLGWYFWASFTFAPTWPKSDHSTGPHVSFSVPQDLTYQKHCSVSVVSFDLRILNKIFCGKQPT